MGRCPCAAGIPSTSEGQSSRGAEQTGSPLGAAWLLPSRQHLVLCSEPASSMCQVEPSHCTLPARPSAHILVGPEWLYCPDTALAPSQQLSLPTASCLLAALHGEVKAWQCVPAPGRAQPCPGHSSQLRALCREMEQAPTQTIQKN